MEWRELRKWWDESKMMKELESDERRNGLSWVSLWLFFFRCFCLCLACVHFLLASFPLTCNNPLFACFLSFVYCISLTKSSSMGFVSILPSTSAILIDVEHDNPPTSNLIQAATDKLFSTSTCTACVQLTLNFKSQNDRSLSPLQVQFSCSVLRPLLFFVSVRRSFLLWEHSYKRQR